MKPHAKGMRWILLTLLIIIGIVCATVYYRSVKNSPQTLEKIRQKLSDEGFKTDLNDFNFSTSPEERAREAAITATSPGRNGANFLVEPDLMEVADSHSAVVVWQQPLLRVPDPQEEGKYDMISWDDFRQFVDKTSSQADAACQAILSGPIAFNLDAQGGNRILLPHLATLKNLAFMLCGRTILALHDGNQAVVWTNLLAATRLVSAWQPEPVEISHRTRFDNMHLLYDMTWQALQTNYWSDSDLSQLQAEWESADFLTNLPEIPAFQCASDLKMFDSDKAHDLGPTFHPEIFPRPTFGEFLQQSIRDPYSVWLQMHNQWFQSQHSPSGLNNDETSLLLFYQDRWTEVRNAVNTPAWKQMRSLRGVMQEAVFQPQHLRYYGQFEMLLERRRMQMNLNTRLDSYSFLETAAKAEAERRVLITAIALERYKNKNGHYPQTLSKLSPEFIQAVPADFMDGQPLRYRLSEDGHCLLYSIGLDCVDDGGNLQTNANNVDFYYYGRREQPSPGYDIVWPYAASADQVAATRQKEAKAWIDEMAKVEANGQMQEQRAEQEAEETRQVAMKKLLADKPFLGQEPVYQGKPLSVWVIKAGQIEEYNGAPEDAVEAIRAIGTNAIPFLLEWMPHPGAEQPVEGAPGWDNVEIAWWALGSEGKSAIPALAHLLNLPEKTMDDYSVWTESAKSISYLGPDAIVPMLTAATNMEGNHNLWELLHNFGNLGTNGAPAVPALIHWVKDPDSWVRDGVVSALGGIGERSDLAVPVLTNALHDSDWMVRRDAGEALGSFANDSDVVLPDLINVVKNPADWQARGGALSGLGKIQDKPEIVIPFIAPYLYDQNNVIQRTAAYALRDLGSEAGYRALLQASDAPSSWPGIGDIIYEVQKKYYDLDWKQSPLRLSRVPGILATKWPSDTNMTPDLRKAIELFANTNVTGTNLLTLADLLIPKQIITGNEPEELTFEFPVSYNAITNNSFVLLLDADTNPESLFSPDTGANIQEQICATNGDTILVWHTIFDPPGRHALQVKWTYVDSNGVEHYVKGPAVSIVTTNFCQFSLDCYTYDVQQGATFHARLPESNALYSIECVTPNGAHLKTLSGSTTNGEFNLTWNLVDDQGDRLTGETFNSIVHITLPDSGRSQTMRGP